MDPRTNCINRIVCGELYGNINTIIEDEAKLVITCEVGKQVRHVAIEYDKITVTDQQHNGARIVCEYTIDGIVRSISKNNGSRGMEITVDYYYAYHVRWLVNDTEHKAEFHSCKTINGCSKWISISLGGDFKESYNYDSKYDRYISIDEKILGKGEYTERSAIESIINENKLDPSFIPTKKILDVLRELQIEQLE
jgi:hypothetical protein